MLCCESMKKYRQLERVVRGFSNHRRIEIMNLLDKTSELSVTEISEMLDINFKTAAEHTRRLSVPGIIWKRNAGNMVRHALSPLGKSILKFLRTLE